MEFFNRKLTLSSSRIQYYIPEHVYNITIPIVDVPFCTPYMVMLPIYGIAPKLAGAHNAFDKILFCAWPPADVQVNNQCMNWS
jgi:hypothetical protein